ncbi:hypothetical protein H5410_003298 [Solanum commersonii]|uniref:Uncharacterized protein n=1 Tax=Solanum commersonii TaxID=4109 RepID=A0A9J6B4A8_SOLCO|nr:hypothetical protein H5410_003298 [Solanum commersonii]
MVLSIIQGWAAVDEPGTWEKVNVGVPEGVEAGVGKDASICIYYTSLLLFLLTSVLDLYTPDIYGGCGGDIDFPLLGKSNSCTSTYFVIRIGKGRDIWYYLALMAISCTIISPMLSRFCAIIYPRPTTFGWLRMDSFWEGMMEMLINPTK